MGAAHRKPNNFWQALKGRNNSTESQNFFHNVTKYKLIEELKSHSSKWIKTKSEAFSTFYWQDVYGAFSVNPSEVELVNNYIANQKEHHKKKTFRDEYRAFLKKYNVEYDERYVWS